MFEMNKGERNTDRQTEVITYKYLRDEESNEQDKCIDQAKLSAWKITQNDKMSGEKGGMDRTQNAKEDQKKCNVCDNYFQYFLGTHADIHEGKIDDTFPLHFL